VLEPSDAAEMNEWPLLGSVQVGRDDRLWVETVNAQPMLPGMAMVGGWAPNVAIWNGTSRTLLFA
jgi:hypothetical protein